MLRLQFEACLAGEAADAIKGNWNAHWESTRQPKHAYFGIMGSRRQVQSSHLEELKTSPIDL